MQSQLWQEDSIMKRIIKVLAGAGFLALIPLYSGCALTDGVKLLEGSMAAFWVLAAVVLGIIAIGALVFFAVEVALLSAGDE